MRPLRPVVLLENQGKERADKPGLANFFSRAARFDVSPIPIVL
jgi:hypothetical protein